MLEFREVTRDTVCTLIGLNVSEDQIGLVTPNAVTLAQARYETGSYVWGLWDGDTPVGLIALVHPHEYPWTEEDGDDPDTAFLWRLMIDAAHQGKGYGRAAILIAIDQVRKWGLPRLASSVVDEPRSNLGFYEALGFHTTGRMVEGEVEILISV